MKYSWSSDRSDFFTTDSCIQRSTRWKIYLVPFGHTLHFLWTEEASVHSDLAQVGHSRLFQVRQHCFRSFRECLVELISQQFNKSMSVFISCLAVILQAGEDPTSKFPGRGLWWVHDSGGYEVDMRSRTQYLSLSLHYPFTIPSLSLIYQQLVKPQQQLL